MTSTIKFLVVDDVEENLIAFEALLRREGLEILLASSGAEALELLLVHEISLAFLDVQMPGMDGFELAELMRGSERTKHVPIIFVTAGARNPQRVFKGYETGAVDFLFKPVEPMVLRGKADVFFELSRQRKELADALKLNEMFVAILGHDLRTPLGAVLTGTEVIEPHLTTDAARRIIQRVSSAGHRMAEIIEHVLDLTRVRLGGGRGLVRSTVRVDLKQLVQQIIDELGGRQPCEVTVHATGDATTFGDPARLLQLFSNLVGNALQHRTAGTPVAVEIEGNDQQLAIRVRNHGTVPDAVLPNIFDPFRGGANSRGLGLGLFIAQQVAVAHGGSIAVTSTETEGTVFDVRLPREGAADQELAQLSSEQLTSRAASQA